MNLVQKDLIDNISNYYYTNSVDNFVKNMSSDSIDGGRPEYGSDILKSLYQKYYTEYGDSFSSKEGFVKLTRGFSRINVILIFHITYIITIKGIDSKEIDKVHSIVKFKLTFNRNATGWKPMNNEAFKEGINWFFSEDSRDARDNIKKNMIDNHDGIPITMESDQSIFDIENWNTSNVTDMSSTFVNKKTFNRDISRWDTSNVTNMSLMFFGASAFNQDIGGWNTSKVTTMESMFKFASVFDANLKKWNVFNVTTIGDMFHGAEKITSEDYSEWEWRFSNNPTGDPKQS